LASGGQWLGIGCAYWRGGGGYRPPFQCIPAPGPPIPLVQPHPSLSLGPACSSRIKSLVLPDWKALVAAREGVGTPGNPFAFHCSDVCSKLVRRITQVCFSRGGCLVIDTPTAPPPPREECWCGTALSVLSVTIYPICTCHRRVSRNACAVPENHMITAMAVLQWQL
jgi:hypothetical protein